MSTPDAEPKITKVDIVILGGGIAGLWLLNRLLRHGFNAILLESEALGHGQSIASQGIIHGGLKYALNGKITTAADAIAEMPGYWRACLDGAGEVDLSPCKLLSDHYYMWSDGGVRSRLKSFLGSKTLRGRIKVLEKSQYPSFASNSENTEVVYRLSDFVVDTVSLISTLSSSHCNRLFKLDQSAMTFLKDQDDRVERICLSSQGRETIVEAQRIIFTAGEGNRSLIHQAGLTSPEMQLRPLKMVVVRGQELIPVYGHYIGNDFSMTPVLTITSHQCENGDLAWYLGGELAESGVNRSDDQQIEEAKRQLQQLFPQVNLTGSQWKCLSINRAEGKAPGLHRPDSVFLQTESKIMIAWPTKFTLSPALADEVLAKLKAQEITPGFDDNTEALNDLFEKPVIARPPWEQLFEHA